MGGDAPEASRRELCACVAALILGALVPASTVPQLETAPLDDLERRFWEALLRDVLPLLTSPFGHSVRGSERV